MIKSSIGIMAMLSFSFLANAQNLSQYQKNYLINRGDTLPYRLLLPLKYDPSRTYPLVFFMHGAGERGSDNEKQLTHGAQLFLRDDVRKRHPAIIVFPQCPENSFWSNVAFARDSSGKVQFNFAGNNPPTKAMDLAQRLLHDIINGYPIDKESIYVGGLSMGAMGTYEMVARNPGIFAAAIAICGGGNPANAKKMNKTNWWIFHGAKDNVVPPKLSEEMKDALKAAGAKVKYTVYPEADHNSWDSAFAEPTLISWLFSQHKE